MAGKDDSGKGETKVISPLKRKLGTPSKGESRKATRSEEKFFLKKSFSGESSSPNSDEEDSKECWAVSKSPMKRDYLLINKSDETPGEKNNKSKSSKALVVSPFKLKRKSEVSKIKVVPASSCKTGSTTIKEEHDQTSISNIEKEILAQIQNSSDLRSKSSENESAQKSQNQIVDSVRSSPRKNTVNVSSNSKTPLKENLKTKILDLDTKLLNESVEKCQSPKKGTPRKIVKVSTMDVDYPKKLRVLLKRCEIVPIILNSGELEEKGECPEKNDNSDKIEDINSDKTFGVRSQRVRKINEDESELAFPLESLDNDGQLTSCSKLKINRDQHGSESENNCRTPSKSLSEKLKFRTKLSKNEFTDTEEDTLDESSDDESSKTEPKRTSLRISTRKETESAKKNASTTKCRKSSRIKATSPAAQRIGLRNRSDIKRPWYDNFEFEISGQRKISSSISSKTPSQSENQSSGLKKCLNKNDGSETSPQIPRKILLRESTKQEDKAKLDSESAFTPRSSKRISTNLSPLVDSVDKISLRNRSEIKRPRGCENFDFTDSSRKRLSLVNSPRTPSQSLRKQVLESTTTCSAKKKLVMGSESSEDSDENDLIPLRRTPRKKKAYIDKTITPSKISKSKVTPIKTTPKKSTPSKRGDPLTPCTPTTVRKVGQGFLTPVAEVRSVHRCSTSTIEDVRLSLHVSTVPLSLPCRGTEFKNIRSFISCKLSDKTGGCMYISGVPGTGKTATVHAIVKTLQEDAINRKISPFDFVEVNGLRLTEARQAYVRIWLSLSGNKVSADQALNCLDKKFSGKPSRPTVLLVDELDYVCNRRQDVVYNILDWCTKRNSRLVVLAIANTMDLPERTLKGRVTSRMGLTRLVFQPYSYQQLQKIVVDRLKGSNSFDPDAVQFVARKVAAVSGDARRALDICRRSTELLESTEQQVTLEHVDKTLNQIYLGRRVQAIKHCSYMAQLLLRSLRDETLRTGVEESNLRDVFSHLCSICNLEGSWLPTVSDALFLCRSLASSGLISLEKGRQDILTKLTLQVSSDDIHYALLC